MRTVSSVEARAPQVAVMASKTAFIKKERGPSCSDHPLLALLEDQAELDMAHLGSAWAAGGRGSSQPARI
jgi:hypothetical protein